MPKVHASLPFRLWYLFLLLPFFAGGFHTCFCAVIAAVLLMELIMEYSKNGSLKITINPASILCFSMMLGYAVTPLWAADKGMAVFGILRCLPVLLLALLLMQISPKEVEHSLLLLPICGSLMTAISCIFLLFPGLTDSVTINGRLSGFLQYPNSFAAFLLAGIVVQGTKQTHRKFDWLVSVILICGIFLSGSRTGILLLMAALLSLTLLRRKISPAVCCILIAGIFLLCGILWKSHERITFLGRDMGSLLIRILYYKDALPVILKHPFGLGYLGYRALETTFQTSRYTVSFVHSSLLQILLDVGWIPAFLYLFALGKTVCSRQIPDRKKGLLLFLSLHCMVDFDLEFFLFWSILLMCMDFQTGRVYHLKRKAIIGCIAVPALTIAMWLGLGDLLYRSGQIDAAGKVVPFHTDALSAALQTTSDPDELDALSDKILALNPVHALSYSAKANAAFARGHIDDMIHYKECAIRYNPYAIEEYCDYIKKLYLVTERYLASGDQRSAEFCLQKILSIPDQLDRIASKTDPLAYQTGNDTSMELPEAYQMLLDALKETNKPS